MYIAKICQDFLKIHFTRGNSAIRSLSETPARSETRNSTPAQLHDSGVLYSVVVDRSATTRYLKLAKDESIKLQHDSYVSSQLDLLAAGLLLYLIGSAKTINKRNLSEEKSPAFLAFPFGASDRAKCKDL